MVRVSFYGTDYPDPVDVDPFAPTTPLRTWQAVDLTDALDGTWQAPEATVGQRSDGVGLFYRGKAHTVSGESESLKTWLALSAIQHEITNDRHVVFIDFEDDAGPVVGRLLGMDTPTEAIRARFHYVRPESPLTDPLMRADLEALLMDVCPSLGVIDGVTEGMTLHGLNPLDNKDAAAFGRMLPRTLTRAGAAAVSLDHVTKSAEGRGRYSLGAVHKLNGLDGAAYVLENRKPAGVGLVGRSTVMIAKDRPGQLRKHALPSSGGLHWFGDLVLDSTIEGYADVSVIAPEAERSDRAAAPTMMMARVAATLAEHPEGLAQRVICDITKGKTETIRTALSHLIAEGYVNDKTPHRLVKPYPEGGVKK